MGWAGNWRSRGRREASPGWHEDLLREIRALETTDPGHDGPVTPIRGPVRRPRRSWSRRARSPRATHWLGGPDGARPPADRRRTVLTVVMTVVVVVALGAVSLGPSAPVVRRLVGMGPEGGGDGHAYGFIHRDTGGRPVGFDPCQDIHFQVNPNRAPADWQGLVDDTIGQVSDATGLTFVMDGTTTDDDYFDRRSTLSGSAEPVLIGWTTSGSVHDLDGDVAGVTSSDYDPGTGHYDTGRVVLDADAYAELEGEPGGRLEEQAILLHELGHLVGLAHVDDPAELMYPTVGTRLTYAGGDRAGLKELGQVHC